MGERFDNIEQIFGRIGEAMANVADAVPDSEPTGTDAQILMLTAMNAALIEYAFESAKAISALNAMLAVVATKTDLGWMVDGPGVTWIDSRAASSSNAPAATPPWDNRRRK
jgi:hypothetical protein